MGKTAKNTVIEKQGKVERIIVGDTGAVTHDQFGLAHRHLFLNKPDLARLHMDLCFWKVIPLRTTAKDDRLPRRPLYLFGIEIADNIELHRIGGKNLTVIAPEGSGGNPGEILQSAVLEDPEPLAATHALHAFFYGVERFVVDQALNRFLQLLFLLNNVFFFETAVLHQGVADNPTDDRKAPAQHPIALAHILSMHHLQRTGNKMALPLLMKIGGEARAVKPFQFAP